MSRDRILLAHEQALILEGLQRMLEPRYDVVAALADGKSLPDTVLRLKPDLVILETSLPLLSGFEAAHRIRRALPRTRLLFLAALTKLDDLYEALNAGANGYLLSSSTREEILGAVAAVLAGQRYISSRVVGEDLDLSKWQRDRVERSRAVLTVREKQILQMLAEGRTAKEIGATLNLSYKTVEFHRKNVKGKLGLRKTVELVKRALQEGLI